MRRSPAQLIGGWLESGNRHPGILERLEHVETQVTKVETKVSQTNRIGLIVFLAVVINVVGSGAGAHFVDSIKTAVQIISALLP